MGAVYEELMAELSPECRARVETRAAALIAEEALLSRRKSAASGAKLDRDASELRWRADGCRRSVSIAWPVGIYRPLSAPSEPFCRCF